jgi:hypothetical protein
MYPERSVTYVSGRTYSVPGRCLLALRAETSSNVAIEFFEEFRLSVDGSGTLWVAWLHSSLYLCSDMIALFLVKL